MDIQLGDKVLIKKKCVGIVIAIFLNTKKIEIKTKSNTRHLTVNMKDVVDKGDHLKVKVDINDDEINRALMFMYGDSDWCNEVFSQAISTTNKYDLTILTAVNNYKLEFKRNDHDNLLNLIKLKQLERSS